MLTHCLKFCMYRYEGNSFLCITSNATCENSSSLSKGKQNNIGLIIGATVGAIVFFIILIVTILCILRCRKNQTTDLNEVHLVQDEIPTQPTSMYQDLNSMQFLTNAGLHDSASSTFQWKLTLFYLMYSQS